MAIVTGIGKAGPGRLVIPQGYISKKIQQACRLTGLTERHRGIDKMEVTEIQMTAQGWASSYQEEEQEVTTSLKVISALLAALRKQVPGLFLVAAGQT